MKAQIEALKDIATGHDAKLTKRSPKTVARLVEAGAIKTTSTDSGWAFVLTEYGTNLVDGR